MVAPVKIRKFLAIVAAIVLAIGASTRVMAQMQEFENRREGTTIHVDALEDFALLGLHRNFQPFPRNSALNVRYFLPSGTDKAGINVVVEAVELHDSVHYLMQSKNAPSTGNSWNIFGQWPSQDVIDKESIDPGNLGVLAKYRVANNPPVYLPVDVYLSGMQLAKHAYTFDLITGQDLQRVDISVINKAGSQVKLRKPPLMCDKSFNPNCKKYGAGSTLTFDLDMSSLTEGEYHVKLTGHIPGNSTPTSLEIVLYHHP